MNIKPFLLSFVFVLSVASGLFAQSLYSSTSTSSRFNPGLGSSGAPVIAYDDVSIPSAIAEGDDSISITKINVGIRRVPNAPVTNVNLYYTAFETDANGTKMIAKASQIFLGKVSLPLNGSSLVTSIISLGDSVTALFKIKTETANGTSHRQQFLIGASFDNPSTANGIILTKAPDNNVDSLWIDNTGNEKSLYATNFNGSLPATYHLEVFGGASGTLAKAKRSRLSDLTANNKNHVNRRNRE